MKGKNLQMINRKHELGEFALTKQPHLHRGSELFLGSWSGFSIEGSFF
jgi:hypothetical protein